MIRKLLAESMYMEWVGVIWTTNFNLYYCPYILVFLNLPKFVLIKIENIFIMFIMSQYYFILTYKQLYINHIILSNTMR